MARKRILIALCILSCINAVVCSVCQGTCECFGNVVDCSKKSLKEVPTDLPEWVEDLNLSKNPDMVFQNDSFTWLPNLVSLSLDQMELTELPDLSELRTLKRLSLNENEISDVSFAWLQSFPSLVELDLGKNKLKILNPGDWNHPNLKKLDLNSNDISVVWSETPFSLPALSSLRLSRNDINAEAFRNLTMVCPSLRSLKTLDLNRNSIQTLQGLMFQHMVNVTVKTLKLRRNKLLHLPDGLFYGLQSLTTLNLDHNENITEISNGWLFGLKALKVLTISHNKINIIKEASWKEASQLEVLDVSFNELGCQHIEPSFTGLHKLKKLFVSNNCLSNLDSNTFEQMSNLNELDLSYNQIQWSIEDSTGVFKGLPNLETLKLAYNKIETIHDKVFSTVPSLLRLDLTGNSLKTLTRNPFQHLPHLKTLSLNTSSLVCNCHLVWLPAWLAANSFASSAAVTAGCGYPDAVKGRSVFELTAANFSCSVSPEPLLIETPVNGTVLFGQHAVLECVARTGGDEPEFTWTKDRRPVEPFRVERYTSVEEERPDGTPVYRVASQLRIDNATLADAGRYQCLARNSFGPAYSDPARVVVHRVPYFTRRPAASVEVRVGQTADLNCAADGFPVPEISWRRENGAMFHAAVERRMHHLTGESSSYIQPVSAVDDGTYVCTATNPAGKVNATAKISVIQSPRFTRPLANQRADLGQSAVLECEGSGKPKPTVTWTKNGRHILSGADHVLLDHGQFLLFMKVRPADAGIYACELTNTLGTLRRNLTLAIAEKSSTVSMWQAVIFAAICVCTTCLIWVAILFCARRSKAQLAPGQSGGSGSKKQQHRRQSLAGNEPIYQTHLNGKTVLSEDMVRKTTPLLAVDAYPTNGGQQDSSSEHSSGKDSGVGDTIHRSSEDLRKNAVEMRCSLKKSYLMYPDPLKNAKGTIESSDDAKPRLSTFGYFDSSKGANATYASLRRGSASRLLPVPSPVMPRNGMSSLPRQAYRSHSSSLSSHHPTKHLQQQRKCNTTVRSHHQPQQPASRAPTPPLFYGGKGGPGAWRDEGEAVESQELRQFGSVSRIRTPPLPNFYSDPATSNCGVRGKKKSLENQGGGGQSFYLPSR